MAFISIHLKCRFLPTPPPLKGNATHIEKVKITDSNFLNILENSLCALISPTMCGDEQSKFNNSLIH
jgi:hypothetical protein